jgi:four helix bundle protein
VAFGHEKLDVYRTSLDYVRWSFRICQRLKGNHRHAREQLLRAAQSIPLNIAEGNAKATDPERRRFFEIARGSTVECAAIQDVLEICEGIQPEENREGYRLLDRIAAMLTRLGGRGYCVREDQAEYYPSRQDGT